MFKKTPLFVRDLLTCPLSREQSEGRGHEVQRADEEVEQAQDDRHLDAVDRNFPCADHLA